MFSLGSTLTYHLFRHPTDMRKGFDSLSGIVRGQMGLDPLCGHVFIFLNRKQNKIKLLHWEKGGLTLYYKRFEQGTIEFPSLSEQVVSHPISWSTLMLMVEGISLAHIQQRKRYSY